MRYYVKQTLYKRCCYIQIPIELPMILSVKLLGQVGALTVLQLLPLYTYAVLVGLLGL